MLLNRLVVATPHRGSFLVVLVAMSTASCATAPGTSTSEYTTPSSEIVENERRFDDEFEVVWDRLVGSLAKTFFVINNIDKESRIINVSFHTPDPERFVDCGISARTFSWRGEAEQYRYEVASDSEYRVAYRWDARETLPALSVVSRNTKLDGRANIFVAPVDGGTLVSVNVKYVVTFDSLEHIRAFGSFGELVEEEWVPHESVVSFTTGEPYRDSDMTCVSRGSLEADVLRRAGV